MRFTRSADNPATQKPRYNRTATLPFRRAFATPVSHARAPASSKTSDIPAEADPNLLATQEGPNAETGTAKDPRVAQQSAVTSAVATLFVLSLCIPIQLQLGSIRLSPYRIVLLAFLLPAIARCLSDPKIRFHPADLLIGLFAAWGVLSLVANASSIETGAIFIVETLGSYILARAYLTDLARFIGMVRILYLAVAISVPFALYEALTGNPIILTLLDFAFTVLPNVPHEIRLGLDRAQFVFDHPILYGLFCSFAFTFTVYCRKAATSGRFDSFGGVVVSVATFLSLSSGAFVCVVMQLGLIAWDRVLRRIVWRWKAFVGGGALLYLALEFGSGRTMPELLVPFISLNPWTAWSRISVNEAAMDVVFANPLIGIGLQQWDPPWWVPTASIDNFWIVVGLRHGLVGLGLLLLAIAVICYKVGTARQGDIAMARCRIAFVITIAALCASIYTVHIWNSVYCFFFFLLGAGFWLCDDPEKKLTKVKG